MTDTPTAGRFDGRDHLLPVRVYYEDTDFTGLVYHANYVRYLERGRSDCLRLMGIGHADLLDGDRPMAFVVSTLELKFLKPARIDDALVVRTTYQAAADLAIGGAGPGRAVQGIGGGGLYPSGRTAVPPDPGAGRQGRALAGRASLTVHDPVRRNQVTESPLPARPGDNATQRSRRPAG